MLKKRVISGDTNVTKKEAEMILKYKDLITETQHMWYIKAKVIPVTTGAMKSISQYHSDISEQHNGKARNRGTTDSRSSGHCTHTATDSRRSGHCTHTAEITDVKAQNIHHGKQQYMLHEL
jgi:hypothetical protein